MLLTQVSDEELQESLFTEIGSIADKCQAKINNSRKILAEIEEQIEKVSQMITEKDICFLGSECSSIIQKLNRCINTLDTVSRNIGSKNSPKCPYVSDGIDDDITFKTIDEGIIRITFPELLPKRMDADKKGFATHRWRTIEKYKNSIFLYFSNQECKIYEEKVVLYFLHHFISDERVMDHDNFETKPVIDCLASCLFVDDSAKYCAHFMDYKIDENIDSEYSEIYIIPYNKFPNFIKQPD